MKFIHLGDLHIGRSFDMHSMLEDQKFVLDQVVSLVENRRPDLVLIAGDIYDRAVPREDAVALYDEFITSIVMGIGVPVYAISGNHDSARRLEGLGSLMKNAGYHIFGSLKNPMEVIPLKDEFGTVHLYIMPYKDLHSTKALFEIQDDCTNTEIVRRILSGADSDPERKILIAHNYFNMAGADLEESESERRVTVGGEDVMDSSVFKGFDYVALGHLHKAQRVGRDSVRYSGSMLKYSLSEVDHRKVITWVEMDEEGNCQIELVPLKFIRDLKRIRGTFHELLKTDYLPVKTDFLSVILTDDEPIDQAFATLSELYPNIVSLSYEKNQKQYELTVDHEAIVKADTRKLFQDFFHDKNGREMNEDELSFMEGIFREMEAVYDPDQP